MGPHRSTSNDLVEVVARFGVATKAKLNSPAASGAPEDQLRAPLETLIMDLAELVGLPSGAVVPIGETSLADLRTRPDYAITLNHSLIGFVEVKAPGKGADPRRFQDQHDKEQWAKLQSLPNLIYTDGNGFSLWRNGEIEDQVVMLDGDVASAGKKLSAPNTLMSLFANFFQWEPEAPRTAAQLAGVTARLCRLLRDEVAEQLARGSEPLTNLATDWRRLLFPSATDEAFADGYAQAVTFGLLMARARDIPLSEGLDHVAHELRQTNTLIGAALRLLTDDAENEATLRTSLATLSRVLDAVHWQTISKGNPDAWLYFYEEFLSVYDNKLRKKTGSYYTPPEVVQAMVGLVDEALRSDVRFGLSDGLASPDVTIADPATGTGTYLLGVLRRIADATEADQGPGAVPGVINAAMERLIGFEIQFGPFAVAQLRILAEVQSLLGQPNVTPRLRLFVTDTLGNPFADEEHIPQILMPLGESRREANTIKRQEKITVVIGNPPYKEKALGLGGWIESGTTNSQMPAPLSAWMPPTDWNVGTHAKHLRNLYVYFWRWATWKVFGDGDPARLEGRRPDGKGIVSFITVAGFLNGPGFQKMRADLRHDADEIWVIDCSPEGHQPEVATRIFQGVQQPVCIVIALRRSSTGSDDLARVRYRALPTGPRAEKFEALLGVTLDDEGWLDCPADKRSAFLPAAAGAWGTFVALEDVFAYDGSGVMPGRTWVIAPDRASLEKRWQALQAEDEQSRKEVLFHPHLRNGRPGDKHVNKPLKQGLFGHQFRAMAVASDEDAVMSPIRYGFRSFDRQWIIPDGRLINQPNPTLWTNHSNQQVYMTAPQDRTPTNGPAISFAAHMPDLHHYHGRGGRVFPLWADRQAQSPNIKESLIYSLVDIYEAPVPAPNIMAYFAAVAAHPAYTERFHSDLIQPGLRFPMTSDAALFQEAVELGKEIIWLHCFGERFVDTVAGRPNSPPRLIEGDGPTIPREGAIPTDPERMPDSIDYDPAMRRLRIGEGFIDNVAPEAWAYEVSGKQILAQWFSYRRLDRSRPIIGDRRPPSPLDKIQPGGWLAEYTSELMNVLHVLSRLAALEAQQADLLERICDGPLISTDELRASGAFDISSQGPSSSVDERQMSLIDT